MRNVRLVQEESTRDRTDLAATLIPEVRYAAWMVARAAKSHKSGLPRRRLRWTFFEVARSICFHQFFQSPTPIAPEVR